jgi:hypothetical protein
MIAGALKLKLVHRLRTETPEQVAYKRLGTTAKIEEFQ